MKVNLKLFVFIMFTLNFILTPNIYALDGPPKISMDLQDASLKDILKILSIQSNLNFLASEAVQDRKLTLYMENVPLKEAMDKLFKANNLSYDLDEEAGIFIVKDWGKPGVETITEVFYLKHATVSSSSLKEEMRNNITVDAATSTSTSGTSSSSSSPSSSSPASNEDKGKWKVEDEAGITQSIKKILSQEGSVIEDFRTNSLIVTDIPSKMEIVRKVIKSLDIPVSQVMLEVEMLDVSKNVVDSLGIKFSGSILTASLSGPTQNTQLGFPLKSWSKAFGGGYSSLDVGSSLTAQIDWLRTQTDTKFLARPKLLTLNNETAEIRISTDESIGVITTTDSQGVSTGTPERAITGVALRVTPQIDIDSGEVTMFIYPEVIEATAGNSLRVNSTTTTGNYQFRDPETRSTKTIVRVKDGETVIVGGLIRNEKSVTDTKIPVLGDIPILGSFFRHKDQTKNKERELLVFITPHIIKNSASGGSEKTVPINQAGKMMLPAREQSTVSVVSRQSSINTYLNTLEKQR
jgi:type II secretory pathway component GspD/PulD (secretin)